MPSFSRLVLAVAFLAIAAPVPASAALTKAQQACVTTENASWQKLAAALAKTSAACVQSYRKGTSGDVPTCVLADGTGVIAGASDKAEDGYDDRCVGLDGDGQPTLPGVFVTDVPTLVHASVLEAERMLEAHYGIDVTHSIQTDSDAQATARCQAGVDKALTKCAAVMRKSFNACKKLALAGKKPFLVGATTPAELATCLGYDPKGAIAKACNASSGDKVGQAIDKQCVAKGADLGVAFAHCGSSDPASVHACLVAPTTCGICKAVNGVDALGVDCDALDDSVVNRSCTPTELLVPAYGNPCCADGPAMWSGLLAAASAGGVQLNLILNPASGPGAGPEIDPNYVADGPVGPLLDVRAAGARVYGYVSTSFASRPIADAKADVDLYYTPSFWRGAGVQVNGVFFDEMSSDLPDVGYYQTLRDYVRAKDANARVIANPGQPSTQDTSGGASGFTVMDYATAADVLVTFEGTGSDYRVAYTNPAWADALAPAHFAHLVHGEAAASDMAADLDLARLRKAGMFYITDDVLVPNPWDSLATYFTSERDLLRLP